MKREYLREALDRANAERARRRETTAWRDSRFRVLAMGTPAWYAVGPAWLIAPLIEEMSK